MFALLFSTGKGENAHMEKHMEKHIEHTANTVNKSRTTAITALLLSIIILAALACLSSCSAYSSHYRATILVQSNTSQRASVSFSTLDGRMVFKMKSKDGSAERMNFSVGLGAGNLKVSVDCAGVKADLLDLKSGDAYSSHLDNIGTGTVYVIIETDGQCSDGNLNFWLE